MEEGDSILEVEDEGGHGFSGGEDFLRVLDVGGSVLGFSFGLAVVLVVEGHAVLAEGEEVLGDCEGQVGHLL